MADVKGLLADPGFQKLDTATQKAALGRVDPAFSGLSDSDFASFRTRMQPQSYSSGFQQRADRGLKGPKNAANVSSDPALSMPDPNRGFVQSVKDAVTSVPRSIYGLATDPINTLKSVPTGIIDPVLQAEQGNWSGAAGDLVGAAITGGLYKGARAAAASPTGVRLAGAAKVGGGAALKATPMLGKGLKAAAAEFEKSSPDYVDPQIARQNELKTQTADRAKARVNAGAEAKAKLKADADAKLKADAEAARVAEETKRTDNRNALATEGRGAGAPRVANRGVATRGVGVPPQANPEITPMPPVDGKSFGGRLYGPREQQPLTPTPPPQRTALWQGNQSQPVAPQMTPQQRATGQLPSGRVPGTGEPAAAPPAPPVRTPLWQRSAPVPNAPIEMTPQQPPTPRAPRVVRDAPQQSAPQPAPPAVAPQPTHPAAVNGGPSAPEGSAVIPPVAGRPNRYGDMGGKLGEQVARDAHAKDTAVAKYLTEIKVTQGQFRAADAAQKAKWAREANPKYKGYTDPDRIDDLANLLQPDAGPTLYQGKQ